MLNTIAVQDELAELLNSGHRALPWMNDGVLVRADGAARAYGESVIQKLVSSGRALCQNEDGGIFYTAV